MGEENTENTVGICEKIKNSWKKILYLIAFGFSVSCFDFSTDVFTGLELLNVIYKAESEAHIVWGSLTFFFLFIPGIMVGIQRLWGLVFMEIKQQKDIKIDEENQMNVLPEISMEENDSDDDGVKDSDISELKRTKIMYYQMWKQFPITLFLCVFCFPIGVIFAQFWHIYAVLMNNELMLKQFEFLTTRMRTFEAFFESGPQLTLQMFIIFYSGKWTGIQVASMCFSLVSLSSTAVFSDLLYAKLKDVKTTFLFLGSILPLYLSSVFFKIGALIFTVIYLRYYAVIPIFLSFTLKSFTAYKLKFSFKDSLEMALCNMTVIYVGPSESKGKSSDESRSLFMMFSTIISMMIFDSVLVILAILFNLNPTILQFWSDILIIPCDPYHLHSLNFSIGILILTSFVNLSLFVAAKYTNLTQTGPQLLSQVEGIINKIDDLDNPEVKSRKVFDEIQCLTKLLEKPYISEFKSTEVVEQIEKFCKLLNHKKCTEVKETSKIILEASNNLIKVINEVNPGVSTSNILHKISGLTRLLQNSENTKTAEQITDLKIFEVISKIRCLLERPEVLISSVHILDEAKDLIQLLNNPSKENISFDTDSATTDKIIDAIRSLRTLLKNPNIQITTPQLLFEIKGITDLLNRRDLELCTAKDERKVIGSMKNLRKKVQNSEHNLSDEILEEINALICLIDMNNFKFDKFTNSIVRKKKL